MKKVIGYIFVLVMLIFAADRAVFAAMDGGGEVVSPVADFGTIDSEEDYRCYADANTDLLNPVERNVSGSGSRRIQLPVIEFKNLISADSFNEEDIKLRRSSIHADLTPCFSVSRQSLWYVYALRRIII